MNEDAEIQEGVHRAIVDALDEEEGALVGWIVIYETAAPDGAGFCGHLYGPEGMTSWRALGLLEWARRHTIGPGETD